MPALLCANFFLSQTRHFEEKLLVVTSSCVNSHDGWGFCFLNPTPGLGPKKPWDASSSLSFLVTRSQKRTLNVSSPATCIMRGTESESQFRGDRVSRLWAGTSRYTGLGNTHGAGNWSISIPPGPTTPRTGLQTPVWQNAWQQQLLVS